MLSFTGSLKIYVAVEPCDMRKGFEGLAGLVTTALHQDLKSGALFVFGNRRRTRLKILYFDGTGIWLYASRPAPLVKRMVDAVAWKSYDTYHCAG